MDDKSVRVTHPVIQVQYEEPEENRRFSRHLLRKSSNFHTGTCGNIVVNSFSNFVSLQSKLCLSFIIIYFMFCLQFLKVLTTVF
jgi:hypothetical protein